MARSSPISMAMVRSEYHSKEECDYQYRYVALAGAFEYAD